jgi:CBS-domain-containing membrane protein
VVHLSPSPFYSLCYSTPLRNLVPSNRSLVAVHDTMPVTEILPLLQKHKILSVPVFKASDNSCLGFIDVLAVLTHALDAGKNSAVLISKGSVDFLSKITAADVLRTAATEPLVPMFADNPASMAVDFMSAGHHRVALFRKQGELVSTCSQSDVIRLIASVLDGTLAHERYAAAGDLPAEGLGVFKPVETVPESTPLIEVLQLFVSQRRSAFAVVDAEGRLVCDISTSDLHDLSLQQGFHELFASLNLPVLEWLRRFSSNELQPVCTTLSATLKQLVLAVTSKRLHRLWVIDGDGKPTHLASLTDILAVFSSGDVVDARMASGDTPTHSLWRIIEDTTADSTHKDLQV